jgi:hypothetical protein
MSWEVAEFQSGKGHAKRRADPPNEAIRSVDPGARGYRGGNDLHICPTDAGATNGASMATDECSSLTGGGAGEVRKRGKIGGERLGQTRRKQELAHRHVARANALLGQKKHESRVALAEVIYPRIGVD